MIGYIVKTKNIFIFNFQKEEKLTYFLLKLQILLNVYTTLIVAVYVEKCYNKITT